MLQGDDAADDDGAVSDGESDGDGETVVFVANVGDIVAAKFDYDPAAMCVL